MEIDFEALKSSPNWSSDDEKMIVEPYKYLTQTNGKEFRTTLINAFNTILCVAENDLKVITDIVGTLHNASLLVDDVEDGSRLRRGVPAAHEIFGVPATINTANYMYFKALQKAISLGPEAIEVLTEEFLNLHRGQALDLYWRDALVCPSEKEYVNMVMNKTGGLFRLSIRLMELKSKIKRKTFVPLVNLLGVAYQIRDDVANLADEVYKTNKGYCEDLTEGKFSFPVIHAIRFDENNKEVIGILKKHTEDAVLKAHVVRYMKQTSHSFEYCERTIEKLKQEALELLKEENEEALLILTQIVEKICQPVVEKT